MDQVNLGWFLLSQTIYNIGTFAIMSSLFQLRFRRHIWTISIISLLNGIITYLIYFTNDLHISYVVPIVSVLITFLYLAAVVNVPIFWSLVVTATGGMVIPLIIQLVIIFCSNGFFMPSELREHLWRNYVLDILSGVVFLLGSALIWFKCWNFKFDFEKVHFKFERRMVIAIAICSILFLPASLLVTHTRDLTLNLTFLFISSSLVFSILLAYILKKEKDERDFLQFTKRR